MKRLILGNLLGCLAFVANAEWEFSTKVDVAPQNNSNKVFHHLDASGRANIAISADQLAVVWEDNHAGSPQVYIAYKKLNCKNVW